MNRAALFSVWIVVTHSVSAAEPRRAELEFFESRIRPVLIEHCYQCHNSADTAEGGLALDHRRAVLKGGDGGPIVVAGDPKQSRLIAVLRHDVDGVEMPQGGPKLDARVVADFEKWIAMGVPDPRTNPPSADEVAAATSWQATLERRKQWWSFRPIGNPDPPAAAGPAWSDHPIDRFILKSLRDAGLEPAAPADPATLVRRLYFNLVGLPPSGEESERWAARIANATEADRADVVEALVEHLLDSPRFGERWARHWMDWIRYAESHGSEGDPANDNAWHYRDYLIRALNADVPYDQLVREHMAGDLLDDPRINHDLEINESAIGPAHWRMVFHGFAPTDALDEKVRFIDDQINAFSKAFLGLTVSCARCHDHKFDAISQKDYYALFGILGSCRPGRTVVDVPEKLRRNRDALAALKPRVRTAIADDWLAAVQDLGRKLTATEPKKDDPNSLLRPLSAVREALAKEVPFTTTWQKQVDAFHQQAELWTSRRTGPSKLRWDLSKDADYVRWYANGTGLPDRPQAAGGFAIETDGDRALKGIYPAGVYTHGLSAKHPARLTSDDIAIDGDSEVWVHAIGDGDAGLRYVVQDYPRNGTVYPVGKLTNEWRWQRYDLSYWNGEEVHIELTAAKDAPLLVKNQPRSWFGVREVMIVERGQPIPGNSVQHLSPIFASAEADPPGSLDQLVARYQTAVTSAIQAWKDDTTSDEQAMLLDACLRQNLIPNTLGSLATAKPLIDEYRRLENEIPVPTRVPGLDETIARDQPLFERGNHKQQGEDVPRRFLEAIDSVPYDTKRSGRRELAEDLLRDDNPLTRRVIVNRVWHHLFGRGIVATPDNLGRLGEQPSHPELLDWLATRFVDEGWSLKTLVRLIVTSNTWQLSSQSSETARQRDPENRLLSHANVRRLEAEAIRDLLLTVSGTIDHRLSGPPVDGGAGRRSVYVRVVRNSLDPFLRAFDFPEPYSSVGRRDVTNVPAQSLALMNNARVSGYANAWARRVLSQSPATTDDRRIRTMFLTAFARAATDGEVQRAEQYLDETRQTLEERSLRLTELQSEIAKRNKAINDRLAPIRQRLLAEKRKNQAEAVKDLPEPIGHWDFDMNADDAIGTAHGELRGGAKTVDGALLVRGGGHVITSPLEKTVREKTLQAWVQLDNLNQRGGGVITIQSPNGVFFDSIVFGEQASGEWLAGSNNFARTKPFNGPKETEAAGQPVHFAIVYHLDGRIIGYRNGVPYGKPYKSNGPYEFKAGNAVIGFGVRHLPAGGNRMLSGRIVKAQLFDRALSTEEVALSAGASLTYVSDKLVMAELPGDERAAVDRLRQEVSQRKSEIESLGAVPKNVDEAAVWSDLAQALFTFKEFIYVR